MTEANYKQLFFNSPVPMYVFDDKTYDIYVVNEAALQQYGYTETEFLNMKATEIMCSDEITSFCNANREVPESYIDFGSWRHTRKNGEIFYVHIHAHTAEFEGKKVRSVLALDIDRKVRTELELKKKNQEIINILESITDGFYALNKKWEVTYFNKTAERVLGCIREDIIGKNLWEFFPASKERFYTQYERVMNQRVSVHFEECYAPLRVWGSMHVYPTNDGIVVYFVDITEQKKIQEKISRDEENLRAIINNTSDPIWSIDLNYKFISANNAFWQRMELITGRRPSKLMTEDFNRETVEEWGTYYRRSFSGETFKIIWSDNINGRVIFEEISFNPILDNKKRKVVGVSCFAREITKQYLYTQMIEKQNEQLKQIAWIQSHELRVPVANILGLVSLFNNINIADPVNPELLSLIKEAAIRMDEIVRRITEQTITIQDIETDFNKHNSGT